MEFDSGLEIKTKRNGLGFQYGENIFGPIPEIRKLDDIRGSLEDPYSSGPEDLYCIAMDVGITKDQQEIKEKNLLFGVVTYAAGQIGNGPVRSQGHIHSVSQSCQYSTPEVYEIWEGEAIIYMQESGKDHAGNCYAIYAQPGDVVIVPPYWVHATVNARKECDMTFGAWCVRDYGFDYEDVRKHNGIAFFPKYENKKIVWTRNPCYTGGNFEQRKARTYPEFLIDPNISIYNQFQKTMDKFDFVTKPKKYEEIWKNFEP